MESFIYNALPARVIFGWGTLSQIAEEVKRLDCKRVMVLTTSQQSELGDRVVKYLAGLAVGAFNNATMHTPIEVTNEALEKVNELNIDVCISVGGGSTIGLGKAIVLHASDSRKIRHIVVPTTYAGSEATPIIGQTEKDELGQLVKTTQRTLKVLPDVILYDVDLTLSLPAKMTTTSGLNAIAHAVEALWSHDANPIVSNLAMQGIAAISKSLPRLHTDPADREGRSNALFGAWACGTCLGSVGMSLHHKLCHTLGGSFGMPHAETHSVIIPHVIAYNTPYAKEAVAKIHEALSLPINVSAAQGLFDLVKENGAPFSLKQLGFKEDDIQRAATLAVRSPYPNPAPLDEKRIVWLLRQAYDGQRPN